MCTATHQASGLTPAEVIPPSPARYWGVVPSQPAPQHNPIPTLNLLQQLSLTPTLNRDLQPWRNPEQTDCTHHAHPYLQSRIPAPQPRATKTGELQRERAGL